MTLNIRPFFMHAVLVWGLLLSLWYGTSDVADAQDTVQSVLCVKAPTRLAEGAVVGHLKSNVTKTRVYAGPTVGCPIIHSLTKQREFLITSRTKSLFGKQWFSIEFLDTNETGWVPAKYLSIGVTYRPEEPKKVEPEPKAVSKPSVLFASTPITPTVIAPTIDLNVRFCPDTACDRIASVSKDTEYTATEKSDTGWYQITLPNNDTGWVSGKYVAVVPEVKKTIKKKEPEKIKPITPAPIPDPCIKTVEHRVLARQYIWKSREDFYLRTIPLDGCGTIKLIQKDQVVMEYGKANIYTQVLYLDGDQLRTGYLDTSKDRPILGTFDSINPPIEIADAAQTIKDKRAYWNSLSYKLKVEWRKLKVYAKHRTADFILRTALILGVVMLVFPPSRRLMFHINQGLLRFGYFALRSRYFWRFIRKLVFIAAVIAGFIGLSILHGLWLINIANTQEKILGAVCILLITISLGWFGVRVLAFFVGVLLLLYSYIAFFISIMVTLAVWIAPSFVLLCLYYLCYRYTTSRRTRAEPPRPTPHFDSEEIERIHRDMFRLRNLYPETIIEWVRSDTIQARYKDIAEVIREKTARFNAFFEYLFGRRDTHKGTPA